MVRASRRTLQLLVLLATLLLLAGPTLARLGGGSSYKSSSSSSSSSSSRSYSSSSSSSSRSYSGGSSGSYRSGSSELPIIVFVFGSVVLGLYAMRVRKLGIRQGVTLRATGIAGLVGLVLLLTHPVLSVLSGALILLLTLRASDEAIAAGYFAGSSLFEGGGVLQGVARGARREGPRVVVAPALAPMKRDLLFDTDPNFSVPVFREFFVLLYCQAMQERAEGRFPLSRPFLADPMIAVLRGRNPSLRRVRQVIVGFLKISDCYLMRDMLEIKVELESNAIEEGSEVRGVIRRETWYLQRRAQRLTQPPGSAVVLACPNCGSTAEVPSNGLCPGCQTVNSRSKFDWVVTRISLDHQETFTPEIAPGSEPEAGTDLPTVVHPELARRREAFLTRHPDFLWDDFWSYASSLFLKLQQGWSQRDPSQLRPHETDSLYRTHLYWIEQYRAAGRFQRLEKIRIQRWELSNVVLDAYYESITARVYASMAEVTTDEQGQPLWGDPNRERPFTEYWTFIRRVGHGQRQGRPFHDCPACGAPLDRIGQTGACGYCDSVVTLGDFDWVLSQIQQDEVYQLDV